MAENSQKSQPQSSVADESSGTPIIELRGVSKHFGPLEVLGGVDLAIPAGQTITIIGESGTGKSVLLKLIIGLLRPDAGEVYFNGRRIDNLPERDLVEIRKQMGFVFQMGALFDSLSAAENVAFPLREHTSYDNTTIDRIVQDKLRLVGLEEVGPKKPAELSGGQRKRVAISRALALDPQVVFFDEPTTGLDPMRADVMDTLVTKMTKDLNVTAVIVTHDMKSTFKVTDRIVMLWQGKFIADGPPEQFRNSTDERIRQFVEGKASQEDLQALQSR